MQIQCESCGAMIPASAIDLQRNLATCAACNRVFSCRAQLDQLAAGAAARPAVPMPKGIRVFERTNGLKIERRWFGPKYLALAFFCVFWDGFMVLWYGIAITQGIWPMAAFGLLHLAVGVGLTYSVLAGFLNRTTITALHGTLEVRHGPIRWPGNRSLPTEQMTQLFTQRRVAHTRNGTSVTYELHLQLQDGPSVKLLSGLEQEAQALFIEQRLEAFLGIQDRPVAGEVERT